MYNISSSLASQTINKNTVWQCLLSLEKVSGELTQFISDRMVIESWAVGVRVVIKRGYKGIRVFKGLSTIISPLKAVKLMMEKIELKSRGLNIIRRGERLFLVDSFQDPTQKHFVIAQAEGLTCSCMKFKCLEKRMHKEAPELLKALDKIILLNNEKLCTTEYYDFFTGNIEEKIHLQCHHIRAVMREAFNAFTSSEYVFNWKQVINRYKSQNDSINDDYLTLFPPKLGIFKRKSK